jgi:Putative peptidoglycan binding domain
VFENWEEFVMKLFSLPLAMALEVLLATGLTAQTTLQFGGYHPNFHANIGTSGLPAGPSQIPYPVPRTLANNALVRSNAWAAYNASVHPQTNLQPVQTTGGANPNRLAQPQKLVDQNRFIEKPNSAHRYNFQFSDNEIRSVQAALRRLGVYSGQVDGILGPDTRRAIADYQGRNKQPVTGQPDQSLNASLGIF